MKRTKPSSSIVKSARRTLDVFEYFQIRRRAATVGEISDALQIPQSSASMLLKSLQTLGYLEYSAPHRTFRPTYRIAILGSWLNPSLFDSSPLTEIAECIGRETREMVSLGLQNGPHLQYVHIIKSSEAVQLTIQVGTLRPMTCTAMGRVLLGAKSKADIRAILRRNNADAADDGHRVHEGTFLKQIEEVQRQGYAESLGRMTPGASMIGMLVPVPHGATPLAIGVGGPLGRISKQREKILATMRRHLNV